jgi:hypothetical protein
MALQRDTLSVLCSSYTSEKNNPFHSDIPLIVEGQVSAMQGHAFASAFGPGLTPS